MEKILLNTKMNYNDIISKVKVYGLEDSIVASKYPMATSVEELTDEITERVKSLGNSKKGSGHDNFLNGIIVQFDLKYSVKAWTEAERYHFFDFVSSQSTMHRITKFDLDKSYIKYVDKRVVEIMKEKVKDYNDFVKSISFGLIPQDVATQKQLQEEKKEKYLGILYTNPCGFQLTARMTTNYRQLKTIYSQRFDHRLLEWRAFCKWVETLPKFKELCLQENKI